MSLVAEADQDGWHARLLDLLLRNGRSEAGALFLLKRKHLGRFELQAAKDLPIENGKWMEWVNGRLDEIRSTGRLLHAEWESEPMVFLPLTWNQAGHGVLVLRRPERDRCSGLATLGGWALALSLRKSFRAGLERVFLANPYPTRWPGLLAGLMRDRVDADRVSLLRRHSEGQWRVIGSSSIAQIQQRTAALKSIERGFQAPQVPGGYSLDFPKRPDFGIFIEGSKLSSRQARQSLSGLISMGEIFLPLTPPVGWRARVGEWWMGRARVRAPRKARHAMAGIAGALALVAVFPIRERFEGDCELQPSFKAAVVAEVEGRVLEVVVTDGAKVAKGQILARLDTGNIETRLAVARQMREQNAADARREQGQENMTGFRLADLKARQFAAEEAKLVKDIERATLRSPLDGRVLTKDLAQRQGTVLKLGEPLCELGSLQQWELQIAVPESDLQGLLRSLRNRKALPVSYRLRAGAAWRLEAVVTSEQQLSQMVYTVDRKNVLYVTIAEIAVPEALRNQLRPGFSGRARIEGERKLLIQVLSRRLRQFLHLHWVPGF